MWTTDYSGTTEQRPAFVECSSEVQNVLKIWESEYLGPWSVYFVER